MLALLHHGNLRQAEEQLAPRPPSRSRSRSSSRDRPRFSPRRSRSPDPRHPKQSAREKFWGPQNSALFPNEDRSVRDLPTTAGDHIRDSETQICIAEGRLVSAQLVMRYRQRLQNAQVRHDSTHDGEMIVSSNAVKSTTGKLEDAVPLLIAILKLMVACFTGPNGSDPGETTGYTAFIEGLASVFHPIVVVTVDMIARSDAWKRNAPLLPIPLRATSQLIAGAYRWPLVSMSSGFCSRCHEISCVPYNCPRTVITWSDAPATAAAAGQTARPKATCTQWSREAKCRFGEECRFKEGHTATRAESSPLPARAERRPRSRSPARRPRHQGGKGARR